RERAGRGEEATRGRELRRLAGRDADLAPARDAEDGGVGDVCGAARAKVLDQLAAGPVVVAENFSWRQRRVADRPIDLAAGRGLLVDEDRDETRARRNRCGREPRRPGADDGDVVVLAQHGGHRRISRLPCWVSIAMPSATRT